MDEQTKALIKQTADQAADRAIHETLTLLGVDYSNPLEAQRDFAALRDMRNFIGDPEMQADMLHLRRWRRSMEQVQVKGILTVVGLVVTGICAAIWVSIKGIN